MGPLIILPADSIRKLFNRSQYSELIAKGALAQEFLRNSHLTKSHKENPPCTLRQMIRYLDESGQWVVEVFQYLRADGTLGASGRPDPKRIRIGDTIYMVEPKTDTPEAK